MEVKERPLIMHGRSIRNIYAGLKTMTRRVIKPQPEFGIEFCPYSQTGWAYSDDGVGTRCACTCKPVPRVPGHPGERLWVKETWLMTDAVFEPPCDCVCYKADLELRQYSQISGGVDTVPISFKPSFPEEYGRWQSPMFMPRDHSRLTLEIKDIKVERVCSISPVDAIKEGYEDINAFFEGWNEINAKRGYSAESNPFVWVIEFERLKEQN